MDLVDREVDLHLDTIDQVIDQHTTSIDRIVNVPVVGNCVFIDVTGMERLTIFTYEGRKNMNPGPRIKHEPYTTLRKIEEASCCKSNQTEQVEKVPTHLYLSMC
jgi:hypothetical protein